MQVAVTVELQTWILGFGADTKVLGPKKLIERIRASLRDAHEQYT